MNPMKKLPVAVLTGCLLIESVIFGQSLTIQGEVVDKDESPIQGIQVRVKRSGRLLAKISTDADGSYVLNLKQGETIDELIYSGAGWWPETVVALSGIKDQLINKVLYRPESAPPSIDHLSILNTYERLSQMLLEEEELEQLRSDLAKFLVPAEHGKRASAVLAGFAAAEAPAISEGFTFTVRRVFQISLPDWIATGSSNYYDDVFPEFDYDAEVQNLDYWSTLNSGQRFMVRAWDSSRYSINFGIRSNPMASGRYFLDVKCDTDEVTCQDYTIILKGENSFVMGEDSLFSFQHNSIDHYMEEWGMFNAELPAIDPRMFHVGLRLNF